MNYSNWSAFTTTGYHQNLLRFMIYAIGLYCYFTVHFVSKITRQRQNAINFCNLHDKIK